MEMFSENSKSFLCAVLLTGKYRSAAVLFAAFLFVASTADAQDDTPIRAKPAPSGGLELVLTNSGFGLGAYVRDSLSSRFSFIAELNLSSGKDEREVAFFDRFGRRTIPGKANYLLMAPLGFGVQTRMFADRIEDSFRPFLQFSGGPTFGWEYPYFNDCNGNGIFETEADCNGNDVIDVDEGERRFSSFDALPRGTLQIGVGGSFGVGAHFGDTGRGVLGVRIAYSFTYFLKGIQLLEETIRPPQYFFSTPTVTIFFGPFF